MSMTKDEKKKLKAKYKESQKIDYSLAYDEVDSLFDYLDEMLNDEGCDHTLRFTIKWIENNKPKDVEAIINEIKEMGGYCDCEVIYNTYEDYELV